ncbi:MAG: hypothetical protein RL456_1772 [Pseudomonadota bacterium]|jgi:outer membrane biosynthesis protein TonB
MARAELIPGGTRPATPRALRGCIALSLALHGAVLAAALVADGPPGGAGRPGRTGAVTARVIAQDAQDAPAAAPAAIAPAQPPSPARRAEVPDRSDAAPAPDLLAGLPAPAAGPAADGEDTYLGAEHLSRRPAPLGPVDLPYPADAPAGQFRAVLVLFIDDDGAVRRIRIEEVGEGGLPEALQDAARQTFLAARFAPGEREGRAVRSRLRIEVEFVAGDGATGG